MKMYWIISLIVLLAYAHPTKAWDARVSWNDDFAQGLQLNCEDSESLCVTLCGTQFQCDIPAADCMSCLGANTFLSHFYREVGRLFTRANQQLVPTEVEQLLANERLIFLTPHGPYNIYSGINDLRTERYFDSLCPADFDSFPVVLARLNSRGKILGASHVICHGENGAEVFTMAHALN